MCIATDLVSGVIAGAYQRMFGIDIPEWRVMAVLAELGEVNQQSAADAALMDKLTVSRVATRLAGRGLVDRRTSETDRRAQLIRLTAVGSALYAQMAPKALELEERLFADFSPEERATLGALLGRVETAARRIAAEEDEAG